MAGEAPQLSFIQGEVSPEYFFRSDLTSFNASLAKAVNVELAPLGGVRNRLGSEFAYSPASAGWLETKLGQGGGLPVVNIVGTDYVSCIYRHYITGELWVLEVYNNAGKVEFYLNGFMGGSWGPPPPHPTDRRASSAIYGASNTAIYPEYQGSVYDIRGNIGTGLRGLRFIVHNDTVIFSKTLPVRKSVGDLEFLETTHPGVSNMYLPDPTDSGYKYTETQFAVRMLPDGYNRVEANFNMQVGAALSKTPDHSVVTQTKYTGAATYALILEDSNGVDTHVDMANSIAGVTIERTGASNIVGAIPYPVNGNVVNWVRYLDLELDNMSYGEKIFTKAKLYRSTGKNDFYAGMYKLVGQSPVKLEEVETPATLEFSDSGQEEAAYTACADTRAYYRQPSFVQLSTGGGVYADATGGLKSVVDTAVYQQRAFYAINKGPWWGTSVYNNSIVASRVGAPGQTILPQITNDVEAFIFTVPEEAGGHLTHLASLSRLMAFTNTSTFIIQGDDAGIIRPTAINPYKILSFGCKEGVAPAVSGETCIFAASTGGVGFVTVQSNGDAIGGYASALASHLFEDKEILSMVPMADAKTFPRWLINTTAGDTYVCYKVGDNFSFFPYETYHDDTLGVLPLMQILNPDVYAEGTIAIRPILLKTDHYFYGEFNVVGWDTLRDYAQVNPEYSDTATHLDRKVAAGSVQRYKVAGSPSSKGWEHLSAHSTPGGTRQSYTLVPAPGYTWDSFPLEITTTVGDIPLDINDYVDVALPAAEFTYRDSPMTVSTNYGEFIRGAAPGTYRILTQFAPQWMRDGIPLVVGIGNEEVKNTVVDSMTAAVLSLRNYSRIPLGTATKGYLVDPTGTWEAFNEIETNIGELPIVFDAIFKETVDTELKLKFSWLEEGKMTSTMASITRGTVQGYKLFFEEDVPMKLRAQTPNIYFYPAGRVDTDSRLEQGSVIVEIAFNKINVSTDMQYFNQPPHSSIGVDLYAMALSLGYTEIEDGAVDIPVTLEYDGLVYGNYKDPLNTTSAILKMSKSSSFNRISFELDLPAYTSYVAVGVPAVAEIETLPVASIQQDITDAKKNIDYASVILYRTKGLRIGEAGQPDVQLEVMDFTTDDSVDVPVPYTGPKGYNFASTWNLEGRIRVSGLDLQPFSISGIIPKGNVGSF